MFVIRYWNIEHHLLCVGLHFHGFANINGIYKRWWQIFLFITEVILFRVTRMADDFSYKPRNLFLDIIIFQYIH